MLMPTSAVSGDPPAGGALRGRIDALTPPARPAAYRAAPGTPTAECTTTGGQAWDPGNIISDQVFYNTSSMTVEQIRDFITTHGEGCSSPWCLKSVRTTVPAQPSDQYCQAIPGATDVDAATVIATVSTACGINPQVMLITLQKESQLLDRTDPTETTYNAAWGWHCPDTGPGGTANCDPTYAGLVNQAYGMAKQWARYRVDPGKYNYQAGQTVTILWNVAESGCGGAPVTIANQATAALYNYTPYQPNAASLAAYPGPTLLINGEFDLFFRPTERSFAAVAADPRRVLIRRATHLSNLDQPARFTAAIRRFAEGLAER
jgi:hypothetical protein